MMAAVAERDAGASFLTFEDVQQQRGDLNTTFLARLFALQNGATLPQPSVAAVRTDAAAAAATLRSLRARWGGVMATLRACSGQLDSLTIGVSDEAVTDAIDALETLQRCSAVLAAAAAWATDAAARWRKHRERAMDLRVRKLSGCVPGAAAAEGDAAELAELTAPAVRVEALWEHARVPVSRVGKTTGAIGKVLREKAELLRQVVGAYMDREKAAMRSAAFRCEATSFPSPLSHVRAWSWSWVRMRTDAGEYDGAADD